MKENEKLNQELTETRDSIKSHLEEKSNNLIEMTNKNDQLNEDLNNIKQELVAALSIENDLLNQKRSNQELINEIKAKNDLIEQLESKLRNADDLYKLINDELNKMTANIEELNIQTGI